MSSSVQVDRPGRIDARPVPHPMRWVAVAVIVVLVAMLVSSFVSNPRWNFPLAKEIAIQQPVLQGLYKGTLLGTAGAMAIGVILGVIVAVMRLSDNPVLRYVSFGYTWFFRAIPRYVLLTLIGSLGFLYGRFAFGVPFGQQLAHALGLGTDLTFASVDTNAITGGIIGGIIGLGLSEAAYMAEIARAGILSVDPGQREAAQAIGMSSGKTTRRIVLPQAMRVIVPPTGNETIAMVKDTSLLVALPVIVELNYQATQFGTRSFQVLAGLLASTFWYLVVCSILMVGQYFLERRFGRGFGESKPRNRRFARTGGMGGA